MPPWTQATIALKALWLALIGLAFAVVLALLATQTIRLEGFKLWPFHMEGWKPRAERLQADVDGFKAAEKEAAIKAKQARLAQEALYNQLAEKADERVEAAKRNAMDAAERYITAHRVRPQAAGGAAGRTSTGAEDHGAQGGNGPGEASKLAPDAVIVSADDIRICTVNTTRLDAVHDWALGLEKGG